MLLYISVYFFTNVCEGDNDSNNVMYELLILSIITFGYLGWFNLLFLWFLYLVKINRAWVMSYRICFVESFLFWTIFYIIRLVIDNLPHNINPSLTPTFAYFLQPPYFLRFSYGLCVLQILFFLYGECFKFNLSYICFACFEGLLHWRISIVSPNGFFPFVVTSFWVLIRRTISVQ